MGIFSSKSSSKKDRPADCGACQGSGVVQTGTSKWTGATFSTCPACRGAGTR